MIIETLIEKFQPGSMTVPELVSHLAKNSNMTKRERRGAIVKMQKLLAGLRLFSKISADRNGKMASLVPEEVNWRRLTLLLPKEQAEWYLENCPEVGTPEYGIFKRLFKSFGIGGNEFYYWLRKLS